MLFDLRGRGRRRTVQIIYVGLALIFLLGFVGLGVGGGFGSNGILDAFTGEKGSSGGASFAAQVSKYKKLTAQQPTNVSAWEQLVAAQLHEAGSGETYVTREGVTSKGKELYAQIAQSWNRYLALNPPKPNAELAKDMVRVFDEEGLNQPSSVVQAVQIVVAAQPNSSFYFRVLAEFAYKAHNTRVGDLAAEKAVSLAPPTQRQQLKTAFAALKKNPTGAETATATTNGKTFTVKSGAKGTFTGTVPSTTSAAGSTPGTKK
jgi:uncharacterized protein (DUF2267 family)